MRSKVASGEGSLVTSEGHAGKRCACSFYHPFGFCVNKGVVGFLIDISHACDGLLLLLSYRIAYAASCHHSCADRVAVGCRRWGNHLRTSAGPAARSAWPAPMARNQVIIRLAASASPCPLIGFHHLDVAGTRQHLLAPPSSSSLLRTTHPQALTTPAPLG